MFPNLNPSHLKTSITKRPAVSLVIALVMVLAFMNLAADIMQTSARTQNIAKGGMSADQAQLNAQLGLELGLYAQNKPDKFPTLLNSIVTASDYTHTVEKDGNNILTDKKGNVVSWQSTQKLTGGEACMETKWTGDSDNSMTGCTKKFFVYPYPGSGGTGGKECDIKTQPLRKNTPWLADMYFRMNGKKYEGKDITEAKNNDGGGFVESVTGLDALDHPCLWNTFSKGNSAEVPLFRIGSDGKEIGAANIKEFYVRARLPCKSGSVCNEDKGRWKLDTKGKADQRALIWNIVTDCKTDTLCYLSEWGGNNNKYKNSVITYNIFGNPSYSMNIKNWILGYQKDGNIIEAQDGTKNQDTGPIIDFLRNEKKWAGFANSKPFFHLSVAAPLTVVSDIPGQTVDSLEYQVLYTQKDNLPPLITNPSVIAQGSNGGYTVSVQSSLSKQTGAFNFSLIGKENLP